MTHYDIIEYYSEWLIIANGESCSDSLLHKFTQHQPKVIVLDSALKRVSKLNIKIDFVIGDFDRGFDPSKYKYISQPEIINIKDQDSTDLEKSLRFINAKRATDVNVLWATGKRADHTIANICNIVKFKDQMLVKMWDDYSKIYRLPNQFEKYYPKDSIISLIPVGTVEGIKTENLLYPLHNEALILGFKNGNSNQVLEDGMVKISYTKGDLLMMECID